MVLPDAFAHAQGAEAGGLVQGDAGPQASPLAAYYNYFETARFQTRSTSMSRTRGGPGGSIGSEENMRINFSRGYESIGRRLATRSRRLGRMFARYRNARRSMRVSISRRSQRGLDWMNFFLADVQTGFGAFVFILPIWAGRRIRLVWRSRQARLRASSPRPRAERWWTQSAGSEVWSRSASA